MAHHRAPTLRPLISLLALAGLAQSAAAFQIDPGNDDFKVHWDTTVLANLGWRIDRIDPAIGNDPTAHQSDYKFPDRGDLWQQRLDLRTEMDVVFRDNFGGRLSAAGWYDHAYHDATYARNPNIATVSRSGDFDSSTKRFYAGPSGELLDAFVFGTFDLGGGRDVSLKLGRHALVWGNSQVSLGEAISWGQQPYNLRKAAEIPGASPKEVAMPLNQLSFQGAVAEGVSVSGYYQFTWQGNRLSEGGTYLGSADFLWTGNAAIGGVIPHTGAYEPKRDTSGNFGLQVELAPKGFEGSVSAIYRKFDEKQPWAVLFDGINALDLDGDGIPETFLPTGFHQSYARGVQIFGLAANTVIGGVSTGVEVHYRKGGALANAAAVAVDGPTGDTWHALVNGQKLLGSSPLWESAVLVAEVGYTQLVKVTTGADVYNGEGYACAGGAAAGCATRRTLTGSLVFQPTWNQVVPGVDLTGSFVIAGYGLKGNTPNLIGGKERSYDYLVGVTADVKKAYKVGLQYADSGARRPGVTTDRGRINLSLTTTF